MMADPFVLLPANLARLADLTSIDGGRFSMQGIHVQADEGSYVVCATDGRRLALVRGRAGHDPLDYPSVPALVEAGDAVGSAVIPAREWKEAFKSLPKRPVVKDEPILAHVALHLGGEESILATTDGEEAYVIRAQNLEWRFPDYEPVIPKGEPAFRADFNCRYLLDLVRIAADFAPSDEEGDSRITLEFRAPNHPLLVRAGNTTQEFLGLLMPLDPPEPNSRPDNV